MGAALSTGNAMEALEQFWQLIIWNAGAGVAHGKLYAAEELPQLDLNLTLKCELKGVGEKVENFLLPHGPIGVGRFAGWKTIDCQPEARLPDGRPKDPGKFSGGRSQIRRLIDRLYSASLYARELEQCVDEL